MLLRSSRLRCHVAMELPEEITLSREEARKVMAALDLAEELTHGQAELTVIETAIRILAEKFLPDLPEL